ncbi:hypothetical protein D9M68_539460 [compost metagenome]
MPDVAGVLDHLGDLDRLADDRCVEFAVDLFQQVAGLAVQLADHGHGREVVVLDRGAFAEEFRVGADAEVSAGLLPGAVLDQRDDHVLHRARQHRAAYHHGVAAGLLADGVADLAAYRLDVAEVEVAVLLARRADADERHVAVHHRLAEVGGAGQAAAADALLQEFFQARFDDGGLALVDQVDLGGGNIHADNFMTTRRQATGTYSADIAEPKDADTHRIHLCNYRVIQSWPKSRFSCVGILRKQMSPNFLLAGMRSTARLQSTIFGQTS